MFALLVKQLAACSKTVESSPPEKPTTTESLAFA
jgi:hypothetical protein